MKCAVVTELKWESLNICVCSKICVQSVEWSVAVNLRKGRLFSEGFWVLGAVNMEICSCVGCDGVINGSMSPRHGASSGCGWRSGLQYGR